MAYAKQPAKRKRRKTALPMLGAAGVSLTMAGGASAAVAPTPNAQGTAPPPVFVLDEEEISDVSLATFYVFDRENQSLGERIQLAQRCGRGCGGRLRRSPMRRRRPRRSPMRRSPVRRRPMRRPEADAQQ